MEKTATDTESPKNTALIEQLFSVGAHFGYARSRRHPSTTPFIFGAKNKVEIFDLEKVSESLQKAKQVAEKLGREGKKILFVGSKQEAQAIIKKEAEAIAMPFVAGRWIGGTLTNFSEIKKRLNRLTDLREKRDKGELIAKYTKREQLSFDREITDLEEMFGGIVDMKELPHALFVVDTKHEHIAVSEARQKKIPIIGLLNSDCDVDEIKHPVVANDTSLKSVAFVTSEIAKAYQEGTKNPITTKDDVNPSEKTNETK